MGRVLWLLQPLHKQLGWGQARQLTALLTRRHRSRTRPSPGSPGNHSTLQGSLGSAAGSSDAASTMSPSQGSPGSPPSGIMGLLPKLENNLVQHMQMAQRDNANVHSFNLSLGTMTAPAPAPAPSPGTLSVSGDLGDVTTVQEGPRVKVEVSLWVLHEQ